MINAFWEKRNIGVETVEFIIENEDTETVIPLILKEEKQYNVVKLPVNKPKITLLLQENGYRFMECMLNFVHDCNEAKITTVKYLVNTSVTYTPMKEPDLTTLFAELSKGLFNTDRIYNDPVFPAGTSAVRYKNWINDECEKGSVAYKLLLEEETIGFFVLKKMQHDIYDPFLLGLYNDYKGRGLGRSMAFNALNECVAQGAKGVSTHISSNNPANIKVYNSLGYEAVETSYIFVRHKTSWNI